MQHYFAGITHLGNSPYKLVELSPGRSLESRSITGSGRPDKFEFENEDFWPALKVLEHCHAVEWAVYTTNGKPAGKYDIGRVAKPVGVLRNEVLQIEAPESKPGLLAYMIGQTQEDSLTDTTEVVRTWARFNTLTAIESASVPHVAGVGILRMTHRADTDNTKVWWGQINEESRRAFFSTRQSQRQLAFKCPILIVKMA